MANVEFSFGGGKPGMPNLAGLKSRFLTIVAVVAVFILLMAATTSIPTGHVGVLTLFGRVTGDVLPEGIHLVNPLKSVEKMSVQTQSRKESASVPSKEGLTLSLDTSLLFRLDRDKAAQVLRTIGVDYAEKIVEPELRSAIRGTTASHSANDLYTNGRELVQQQIKDDLISKLAPRGVIVEDVLLRDVQLPPLLKASIEAKQEAEQKSIEAKGIADFQKIVAQGISAQLLEWKGIEATEKLAASQNTKIVVIGNTKNGLPLVFEPK